MEISAAQVKELRELTGAGMMECKKALVAADGDMDAAIDAMRKAGQAQAIKKQDRTASEGVVVILISADGKSGVITEVNSETDFVARHENFAIFANQVASAALNYKSADIASLMNATIDTNETVEAARQALVAKMGENIQVRRFSVINAKGNLAFYTHGGRIGVLVDLVGGTAALAKDIAMHIAASKPIVVTAADVPADLIAKEKEIYLAQAQESRKPPEIVEKMTEGRIKKFLKEVSLLGQPFVKDPDMDVEKVLQNAQAEVASFVRYEVGEGIEKKESNFVEEVMAQVRT